MNGYTEKEVKLLDYFGCMDLAFNTKLMPPVIYQIMVERAFVGDLKGKEVESLRRCWKALSNGTAYRNTPEWDELIEI